MPAGTPAVPIKKRGLGGVEVRPALAYCGRTTSYICDLAAAMLST